MFVPRGDKKSQRSGCELNGGDGVGGRIRELRVCCRSSATFEVAQTGRYSRVVIFFLVCVVLIVVLQRGR